eukprot:Nitzschia sp. Nitz4//scaffold66_size103028//30349//32640//NITZ4_004494-RA/size103028-snap-gene-0.90-mRNA-1//1//CDS//3329556338//3277//frame0
MATFASQASNLSALNSSLIQYGEFLKNSVDRQQDLTEEEHRSNASRFLEDQQKRVSAIDDHLLKATELILPESKDIKTVTEMAELCGLVQEASRSKMSLIRTRLELLGIKTDDSLFSPKVVAELPPKFGSWSLGAPLDCVQEGDVETEGATTPGSLLQPSPFGTGSKRKTSLTPTTPTLDRFSFSAETSSMLKQMELSTFQEESPAPSQTSANGYLRSHEKSVRSSRRSTQPSNLDGFHDDDDMITLNTVDTHSTGPTKGRFDTAKSPMANIQEERSQFLARMESMLERVEEEILHESRPTDEHNLRKGPALVKPVAKRPTQIVLDSGVPSPAHTNITMDATMLNDTMVSASIFGDDDNLSTVTPVLDRYRLDFDDNSVGIKVVPNKRGMNSQNTSRMGQVETIMEVATPLQPQFEADDEGFMSPRGIPGSVSNRKKKQYRKTPLPKKQLHDSFQTLEDENDNPNISCAQSSPSTSFTIPPLRPQSFGTSRSTSRADSRFTSKTQCLPGAVLPRTPVQPSMARDTSLNTSFADTWMEKITRAEYGVAPNVVQLQVSRDEVNHAIDILENHLRSENYHGGSSSIEQSLATKVLKDANFPEMKAANILTSLCHWKRLVMKSDERGALHLAINQFD